MLSPVVDVRLSAVPVLMFLLLQVIVDSAGFLHHVEQTL